MERCLKLSYMHPILKLFPPKMRLHTINYLRIVFGRHRKTIHKSQNCMSAYLKSLVTVAISASGLPDHPTAMIKY